MLPLRQLSLTTQLHIEVEVEKLPSKTLRSLFAFVMESSSRCPQHRLLYLPKQKQNDLLEAVYIDRAEYDACELYDLCSIFDVREGPQKCWVTMDRQVCATVYYCLQ